MEERICNKWLFVCRRDLVVCVIMFFLTISLVLNMIFTFDAERMRLKREKCKEISASMV